MALSQALRCSVLRSAIPLACSPVCGRVSASAAPHFTAQSHCLRTSAFVPSLSAFRPKVRGAVCLWSRPRSMHARLATVNPLSMQAQRAQQSASFATQAVKKGDKVCFEKCSRIPQRATPVGNVTRCHPLSRTCIAAAH